MDKIHDERYDEHKIEEEAYETQGDFSDAKDN